MFTIASVLNVKFLRTVYIRLIISTNVHYLFARVREAYLSYKRCVYK